MRRGDALLAAGYALAIVPTLQLRSIVGARDDRAIALLVALEAGHLLVAAGWALKGRRLRAAVNVAALAAYPAVWMARGPRPARAS